MSTRGDRRAVGRALSNLVAKAEDAGLDTKTVLHELKAMAAAMRLCSAE